MENLTRENAKRDNFVSTDLDTCIDYLIKCREDGKSVWVEFGDKKLYSCDATVNNLYIQVLGKTKEEYDTDEKEYIKGLNENTTNASSSMQKSEQKKWIEFGKNIIYPERVKEWEKCVGTTTETTYGGEDLEKSITVMQMLDGGTSFANVQTYMEGLSSSENSTSRMENIILNFSKQGPEFFEYIKGGMENIDDNTKRMVDKIRNQNKEYEVNEILTSKGPEWRKKAESLIYPERMQEWERIMRVSASQKLKGTDVDMALGAMELLDRGVSFDNVEKFIEDKSITATSATMAEDIVLNFSKRGPEFFESIRPDDSKELVSQLKKENADLEQKHRTKYKEDVRKELLALASEKKSLEKELKSVEKELATAKQIQAEGTIGRE